jgi:hypothetical protein
MGRNVRINRLDHPCNVEQIDTCGGTTEYPHPQNRDRIPEPAVHTDKTVGLSDPWIRVR